MQYAIKGWRCGFLARGCGFIANPYFGSDCGGVSTNLGHET
jgi:hypothetical protein